ncbi:MAG: aminopeptidase [Nitrososphaerales archaeon]
MMSEFSFDMIYLVDQRVAEHAKILVNYSCKIKNGDFVLVVTNGTNSLPLIRALAAEIAKKGAFMEVQLQEVSVQRAYLMNADDQTLETLPRQAKMQLENLDVLIQIIASSNTQELEDVPPSKLKANSKSTIELFPIIMSKRWNITLHPTRALAQEARKSFESYSDFVYSATLRDWEKMAQEMQILADKMASSKKVRLVGKETDISFSIEGRKPLIDAGEHNLPGGEVFTSPDESTVNGNIYYDLPINYMGKEIIGVRLVYKNGLIVEHSAETGGKLLDQLFQTDDGARRLGELGIGMNRGITQASKSILFDEKMGDTIHMAVGHAFEEAGGKNASGIHIDMIKSMKEEGTIYFDESPIYENGKFVWE